MKITSATPGGSGYDGRMAINHADLTTLGTLLLCPIVAGVAAADAHAGWFTPIFIAAGLAAGCVTAYLVRRVAYAILATACRHGQRAWVGWPLIFLYTLLPQAVSAAGVCAIWFGTIWIVKLIA
jgi:hypothetical protein